MSLFGKTVLLTVTTLGLLATASAQTSNGEQTNFDRTFSHHTVEVNGVRLHYVSGGKGEALILLHGFPQTWREWKRVMPALAQHYTVIAPDYRGAGDSAKTSSGYDKRTMAEDIYQMVRKLGFLRVYLAGHDIGMQIAYSYAAAHPEGVRRLVLLEAAIPGTKDFDEVAPKRWHFSFHAQVDIADMLVAGKERAYLTEFYRGIAYNPAALTEEDINEYVRCYSAPGRMRAGFELYRAFTEDVRQNREYLKQKLSMPVLALAGEASPVSSFMQRMMEEVAQNPQVVTVPRAGHWVAEENPDFLIQQVLAFLSEK